MKRLQISESLNNPLTIILFFSCLRLLIHFIFNNGYGIFRDELYYVAAGEHLAWGYVDQPPMVALIAKITTFLFGKSLFALRLFPSLAGALVVFITGLIIKELGGQKFALILGLLAVTFTPVLLGICNILSMNSFDVLFASILFLLLSKIIIQGNDKLWIWFGIVSGVALLNKISPLFIVFGLFIGLLFTENRKYFLNKNLWIGVALAIIIFLPHVIWQYLNNFPTLEFMSNASKYKNVDFTPIQFIGLHFLDLHPNSVIYVFALISVLFFKRFKNLRIFSLIYLAVLGLFLVTNAKPYYIAILIPAIISVGVIVIEYLFNKLKWKWIKPVFILILIPSFVATVPFALPVLDPQAYISYSQFLGITPAPSENTPIADLPQHFADQFGWEELAKTVSEVYLSLPDSERKNIVVYGQNYGQAGAIDFYRDKYPLPAAISGHNNYWLWGTPENMNDSVMIVIGSNFEDNSEFFEEVEEVAKHYNKYGRPIENVSIFICRKPKHEINKEVWNRLKFFI